jgi:hypothetical protein
MYSHDDFLDDDHMMDVDVETPQGLTDALAALAEKVETNGGIRGRLSLGNVPKQRLTLSPKSAEALVDWGPNILAAGENYVGSAGQYVAEDWLRVATIVPFQTTYDHPEKKVS